MDVGAEHESSLETQVFLFFELSLKGTKGIIMVMGLWVKKTIKT